MLSGSALGAAIKEAMRLKKVTQAQMAAEFEVLQPSVSYWSRTGRIAKDKIDHLMRYFSDVVGPEHWGLTAFSDQSGADGAGTHDQQPLPSPRSLSLARRLDALVDPASAQVAYARISNILDAYEAEQREAAFQSEERGKTTPAARTRSRQASPAR